jgi:cyanate permease
MFTGVPILWYFVKQKRPEYYGLLPDGVKFESDAETDLDAMIGKGIEYASDYEEIEFTLRQAVKTPAYWLITVSWLFAMAVGGAINTHCIPMLTDMGISESAASGMMAMMVFFTVPARFVAGILADRVRKDRLQFLVSGAFLLQAVGIGIFLIFQNVAAMYVFLALFGFGSGAPVALRLTMGGRYFGRKAFASIQGTSMVLGAPVALFAPVYAGSVYDTTGSYITAFIVFVTIAVIAAVLMALMRPPKPPEQVGDIRKFL